MHLITEILIIMTVVKFCDPVKLLSKSIIGLQKINKTNKKHFGGCPTSYNLWNRPVFEYIKPVHSTQFHPPR